MKFWAGEIVGFDLSAIPGGSCDGASEAKFRVVTGNPDDSGLIPVFGNGRYHLIHQDSLEILP